MKKALFVIFLISALALTAFTAPVSAKIPSNTLYNRVAMVDNQIAYINHGMLPENDIAFANFTFTEFPWVNLTSGNLTNFDIVVLLVDDNTPSPMVTPQQAFDINAWVFAGGKLIIYDSEQPPQNYSWLVYPFNTSNVGALGSYNGFITLKEENTLGSNNPANTFYYINTTVDSGSPGAPNSWRDAIGDCNLFTTFDPHWCGDIKANRSIATGLWQESWVHAYARYGNGLMIYNGLDLDPIVDSGGGNNTVPAANGVGAIAKIWLLELAQPWGSDYNLPCGNPITGEKLKPVGGSVISADNSAMLVQPGFIAPFVAAALIAASLVVLVTLYRKNGSRTIQ